MKRHNYSFEKYNMTGRTVFPSGAKWESIVGYSRAVKVGNTLEVSGTIAIEDNKIVAPGDPYEQAKAILNTIKDVIEQAGGTMANVTRTRIYVTDINQWEAVGKAHGEYFKGTNPATSMVEVSRLIIPEALVEIEATAIID